MRVTGRAGPRSVARTAAARRRPRASRLSGPASDGAAISRRARRRQSAALLGLQDVAARRRTGGGARSAAATSCWIGWTSCGCGLLDGVRAAGSAAGPAVASSAGEPGSTATPSLRGLLEAIEVRCAVELAKLEARSTSG